MNVRDSEVICGLLRTKNYELTTKPDDADIIIFNTCSVRQHAEDKVWSEIGRFSKLKAQSSKLKGPNLRAMSYELRAKPLIGLVGCMAQNYKEKIFERAPSVDFVVGPSDIDKIPQIIDKLSANRYPLYATKIWETDGEIRPEEIYHTNFYQDKEHAYVVISEGCSNYCSYCVVPYVRGQLRNRNYKDILKEIEEAVDRGIVRITLLGQNANSYISNPKSQILNLKQIPNPKSQIKNPGAEFDFIDLLEMVNKIKGLKEFSFITSHPKDTSLELFKAMANLEKLKKYLHLPVQSGSDRILKLMNRGYTRKFYLDLTDNYRKIVKDGVLTTDIIVGFPTEKEEDFKSTYDLIDDIEFDAAYIFKYSPRPNTKALNLLDDVTREEKEKRHSLILELQKKISKDKTC